MLDCCQLIETDAEHGAEASTPLVSWWLLSAPLQRADESVERWDSAARAFRC